MEFLTFKMRPLTIASLKERKISLASFYLKQNKMPSKAYFLLLLQNANLFIWDSGVLL